MMMRRRRKDNKKSVTECAESKTDEKAFEV
jgi:hypothetical protein